MHPLERCWFKQHPVGWIFGPTTTWTNIIDTSYYDRMVMAQRRWALAVPQAPGVSNETLIGEVLPLLCPNWYKHSVGSFLATALPVSAPGTRSQLMSDLCVTVIPTLTPTPATHSELIYKFKHFEVKNLTNVLIQ